MNNNIIPACIIGAGLFAVALKPAPQPAPIPQAEPVEVATASVTGPSEPVIVCITHRLSLSIMQIEVQWSSLEHGLMGPLKWRQLKHFGYYQSDCNALTELTMVLDSHLLPPNGLPHRHQRQRRD